ncbi:MAG: hypothetical protein IJC39_05060, partial [Firmicutes bacterium]|nr:hypothetical protein [Bacillota bacterium]
MKKAVIIVFAIASVFIFSGCTGSENNTSDTSGHQIDISAQTTETDESAEKIDLVPMVMIDGNLYLDTGLESSENARCGVMDGKITSSVDAGSV